MKTIILLCLIAVNSLLFSATFTVTNLNDSGAGSLRQAISDANINSEADIINFQSGLSGTIDVESYMDITEELTINGPGANAIILDADTITNIFYVDAPNCTINRLTFIDAFSYLYGGAVYINAENTTINECIFTNCWANLAGGAIAVLDHFTTISNCSFTSCLANLGSAVLVIGGSTNTIENCTFYDNEALNTGGAIFVLSGNLSVTNCTIFENTAGVDAGGIYLDAGVNISLKNSIVAGNTASSNPDIFNEGTIISDGYNIISDTTGANLAGDISTNSVNISPAFSAYNISGGNVPTLKPTITNPAIDFVGNSGNGAPTADARGFSRIGKPDCGAYEYSLSISTKEISNIVSNKAESGGIIDAAPADPDFTSINQKGIVWSSSPQPELTINESGKTEEGVGEVSFNSTMTDLAAEGQYFVRAYATNSDGTLYGEEYAFTTIPTLPEWGMIIFGVLTAGLGGFYIFKRYV